MTLSRAKWAFAVVSIFCLLQGMLVAEGFRSHLTNRSPRHTFRQKVLYGIDVSNLPYAGPDAVADFAAATIAAGGSTYPSIPADVSSSASIIQSTLIVAAGATYIALGSKPRGACRDDLVEIRKTGLLPGTSKSNLGVFAKKYIPEGTLIGRYPGYVKNAEAALASKNSDEARATAQKYFWDIGNADNKGLVLDPTNDDGLVDLELTYLLGLVKVPTTLARMNEPPKGGDCNVYTRILQGNLEIIAERDIFSDEEIYVDYGPRYDREDYGSNQLKIQQESKLRKGKLQQQGRAVEDDDEEPQLSPAQMKAARLRDEEDMMTLQPIVGTDLLDPDSMDGAKNAKIDTSTSRKDGFLSKLNQKESEKAASERLEGILSPEEAMKRFAQQGSAMFSAVTADDQELMESLSGANKSGSKQKSTPAPTTKQGTAAAGGKKSTADLLDDESFKKLMGIDERANETDDPAEFDIFNSLLDENSAEKKLKSNQNNVFRAMGADENAPARASDEERSNRKDERRKENDSLVNQDELGLSGEDSELFQSVLGDLIRATAEAKSVSGSASTGSSTSRSFLGAREPRLQDAAMASSASSVTDFARSFDDAVVNSDSDDENDSDVNVEKVAVGSGFGAGEQTGSLDQTRLPFIDSSEQVMVEKPPLVPPPSALLRETPAAGSAVIDPDEGDDLLRRLDNLTDEQVEAVFAKMRKAVQEKMEAEMREKIEEKKYMTNKVSMPRAQPLDPSIREKYGKELDIIEDELEKLYEDPMAVLQDMMNNPEKFSGPVSLPIDDDIDDSENGDKSDN